MRFAVGGLGIFFIGLGTTGFLSPRSLFAALSWWHTGTRLYLAAVARVALGAVLVLGATGSRAPFYLKLLGTGVLLAGLATPLLGTQLEGLLGRWRTARPVRVRLASCGVALVGASLLWAVSPPG